MKYFNLILVFFFVIAIRLNAQQNYNITNLHNNELYINPAFAGIYNYTPIILSAQKANINLGRKTPQNQFFSANFQNKNYGIASCFFNNKYGNTSNTGASLIYSYHIYLNTDIKISFALAAQFAQFTIDQSNYIYFENEDPLIYGTGKESFLYPNADFGVLLYTNNYNIGLSSKGLLEPQIKLSENTNNYKVSRNYNFYADYNFNFNKYKIKPMLFIEHSKNSLFNYIFNIKFLYENTYFISIGNKNKYISNIAFGLTIKGIIISYSYSYRFVNSNAFNNIHQIGLGININK